MEKIVTRSIKWILALAFLFNLGLVNIIKKIDIPSWEGKKVDSAQTIKMGKFMEEMTARAKADGDKYTPERYFSDLIEVEKKKKELPNALPLACNTNELTYLSSSHIGNYTDTEIDKARSKFTNYLDPGREGREKLRAETAKKNFWPSVRHWLLMFYLKNFILAFFLLWLWWYKEKKKLAITNPLSFLISLLLYPFTIGRIWYLDMRDAGKRFVMESTLRRTKAKLFNFVSPDELAVIRRFARDKRIKDYKNYLRNRGLVAKHSFLPAALVAIVLLITLPKVSGNTQPVKGHSGAKYFLEIKAPPGIEKCSLSYNLQNLGSVEAILPTNHFEVEWTKKILTILTVLQTNKGFAKAPDPIPLSN